MARTVARYVALAATAADACARAIFQGIGDLPGGMSSSYSPGVSADGLVVVGASNSLNGTEAFRWTEAGGMQGLGALFAGNFHSEATGVSSDGAVVVGSSVVSPGTALRVLVGHRAGIVGLGMLLAGYGSQAAAFPADGSVVVGRSNGVGFQWTHAAGMQSLNIAPGVLASGARDVSGDGSRIVGWAAQFVKGNFVGRAFLLGGPAASTILGEEDAPAISLDGQTVVGSCPIAGVGRPHFAGRWPRECRTCRNFWTR